MDAKVSGIDTIWVQTPWGLGGLADPASWAAHDVLSLVTQQSTPLARGEGTKAQQQRSRQGAKWKAGLWQFIGADRTQTGVG